MCANRPRITVKLAKGCYADAHGITVRARIGSKNSGTFREARDRFALTDGAGVPYSTKHNRELVARHAQLVEDLRTGRVGAGTAGAPGSVTAAITRFLLEHPASSHDPTRKNEDYKYLLPHWQRSPVGAYPAIHVPRLAIKTQIADWLTAGVSPSAINSRKRVLGDVLRVELERERAKRRTPDADDVIVPTALIKNVRPRELEARGIDMPILLRILDALPDHGRAVKGGTRPAYSETKIRLTVMAWTGLSQKSLTRLERRHVNFDKGRIFLPPRKKGQGAPGVWVDALPQAIAALRAYDTARLWRRSFSRAAMRKSWMKAVARVRATLVAAATAPTATDLDRTMHEQFENCVPLNSRPYDVRHSFLTEALRRSGNMRAVQALAQHRDIKTTERYTKGAVPELVSQAIADMRAVWAPEPASTSSRDLALMEKAADTSASPYVRPAAPRK
jgi:integrase